MSEERNFPVAAIQAELERHQQDLLKAAQADWLGEVVGLLCQHISVVPPLLEKTTTIPEYIYPH